MIFSQQINVFIRTTLIVFSVLLICPVEGRVLKRQASIETQYKSCKGKDIYKLDAEFKDTSETEAAGTCIDCFISAASDTDSLEDTKQVLQEAKGEKVTSTKTKKTPYIAFKDQLRKRVLGQVKTKIAQTQILQKCTKEGNTEKHRGWFTKRFPKVDWPLMKALCEKKRKDFHTSVEQRWSDMRVSLALTSVNANQLTVQRPDDLFAGSIPHEVTDFGSTPELTEEEQEAAKEKWAEHLSEVPLDKLSPEQLTDRFLKGESLATASTGDLHGMKRATWNLQKQSRDRYRQIIDEMPLLGYMKTGDPENKQDMDQAFSKYTGHLKDLLEKVKDKNVDMSLLLSFEPLVEGLLKDNEGYCLVAEGARLKAERDEILKKWGLVAAGVVAAVPCFMSGPPGAALCLGAGLAVGATGYSAAKGKTKEALERYLTGREFETLASLAEKDSEAFWELMLLPTAAWGTTAGTAQFVKGAFKKGASSGKKLSSPSGTSTVAKSSSRTGRSVSTGIESYEDTLGRLARSSLGVDDLSPQQMEALEDYHSVVRGEKGPDGTFARAGNYTLGQRRKIIRLLESKGFSREQVRRLIEDGVVEINRTTAEVNNRRVLKKLREGKVIFVNKLSDLIDGEHNPFKISELLEETDYGFLVKVEKLDPQSGQLLEEKRFFAYEPEKDPKILFEPVRYMGEILDKTDNGFIISTRGGDEVFFSFEEAIKNGLLPKNPTAKDYRELENVLSSYRSNKLDQIPALKDVVDNRSRVIDKEALRKFTQALDNSFIELEYSETVRLDNPESEAIFSAASSTRKKISSDELNLPPSTKMETQLAEEGYRVSYTGELDSVSEWARVRRRLQELKANPRTTHIEYFADQVPDHIAHIRRGLETNYSSTESFHGSKLDQLTYLKEMEKEATEAISNEEVTYKWWLEFNNKLSKVMSGLDPEKKNPTPDGGIFGGRDNIEENISYFPLRIIAPTIKGEDIGIMAFNRAGYEGIYPAGLIDKPIIEAEGVIYNTAGFLAHDKDGHTNFVGNRLFSAGYSAGHRLFHGRLLKNMENLPAEKRKKAEIIYFLMTHENRDTDISNTEWTPQKIKEAVIKRIKIDPTGLFKFPDDPLEQQEKLEDLADTFMEAYNRAQQHQ